MRLGKLALDHGAMLSRVSACFHCDTVPCRDTGGSVFSSLDKTDNYVAAERTRRRLAARSVLSVLLLFTHRFWRP